MAYVLKEHLANKSNYGSKRDLAKIEYLAIHYTTNDGDTSENNGKYFANNVVKASAHYFVDSDSVTRSVPDNYVAWAVGGNKYNNAGGRLYGIANNTNTLSIEICDDVKNGVVYPSQATIDNVISLAKTKMVEYGLDKAHVIRHYDVNGKPCPKYWVNEDCWDKEFHSKLVGWALYNDNWYWLDGNGNVVKNTWIQYNQKWYRLGADGIMFVDKWIQNNSGTWSYVGPNGDALTGWQQLAWNGVVSWYCFDFNGNMVKSQWINHNGKDYYVTFSGAMATNCYIKSTTHELYYWVNEHGVWEPEWNTETPNLTKYQVVV